MLKLLSKLYAPIFVKNCTLCKALLCEDYCLCFKCWSKLQFIGDPKCPRCSVPFATSAHLDIVCDCASARLLFSNAYSVVKYNQTAKQLILQIKSSHDNYVSRFIAQILWGQFADKLKCVDYICPVPLSNARIKARRFNQVAVILGKINGIKKKLILDLLYKHKDTSAQSSLSKRKRALNVKGAFVLNNKYGAVIKNKTIAIFDDVLTTGATANECTKALLEAGARDVKVFSFARAVID